jgi:hypothetical protein
MKLSEKLSKLKILMDEDTYIQNLESLFVETCRGTTVEDLLCRWWDAAAFCALFRCRENLPMGYEVDHLILSTLLNYRKKGELSIRERIKKQADDRDSDPIPEAQP